MTGSNFNNSDSGFASSFVVLRVVSRVDILALLCDIFILERGRFFVYIGVWRFTEFFLICVYSVGRFRLTFKFWVFWFYGSWFFCDEFYGGR